MTSNTEYMTPKEAAKYIGESDERLDQLILQGIVDAEIPGRGVSRQSCDYWRANQKAKHNGTAQTKIARPATDDEWVTTAEAASFTGRTAKAIGSLCLAKPCKVIAKKVPQPREKGGDGAVWSIKKSSLVPFVVGAPAVAVAEEGTGRRFKSWTKKEIAILKKCYGVEPLGDLARRLERTPTAVIIKYRGLRKAGKIRASRTPQTPPPSDPPEAVASPGGGDHWDMVSIDELREVCRGAHILHNQQLAKIGDLENTVTDLTTDRDALTTQVLKVGKERDEIREERNRLRHDLDVARRNLASVEKTELQERKDVHTLAGLLKTREAKIEELEKKITDLESALGAVPKKAGLLRSLFGGASA